MSRNVASTASDAIVSVRRECVVHAGQLCAVSRVWNDSATTVPSMLRDAAVLDGEAAGAVVDLEAADEPLVVREARTRCGGRGR